MRKPARCGDQRLRRFACRVRLTPRGTGKGTADWSLTARDIELDLCLFVAMGDPIKICRLRIRNGSRRPRRLSLTAYAEWVLGTSRGSSAPFILTEHDPDTGALFARNPWDAAFGSRVAFADLAGRQSQWTADRGEFLGRHGTLDPPAAMNSRAPLAGRAGAGLDPCCALRAALDLEPGRTAEMVFFLGEAQDAPAARSLLMRYRGVDLDAVFRDVVEHWEHVLGAVQVKTPDRSLDIMLNRWLLYQALACRIWARTAFYQASGAYGFRDQLQDGMALAVARPDLTREHLLRAGARQFGEGDVQHWWLPAFAAGATGQGVRTRIGDDVVWLAYCAIQYIETSGDGAILDEEIAFLDGRALQPGEHDAFFMPGISDERATLFEHCARGLDHALEVGVHGLPLFGTGDWNDGMNRVGEQGKGESVWLGWFLHATLTAFAPVAAARGESVRATRWLAHAAALRESLEQAWDGDWYRRGYFDDGTPLGAAGGDECRIDSIAQTWSVISGAGDAARAVRAMANVESQLVRPDAGLVLLFTPPFDRTSHDPGYIKGYPPGIRENGGQYTSRRRVGGDRTGDARAGRRGRQAVRLPQSHQSHEQPGRCAALQGRALRGGRRCLFRGSARGPRGLDLVHGLGRLDVPRGSRVAARISGAGRQAAADPEHSRGLAQRRNILQARVGALRDPH